ncbi:MAG: flagellar biosynthesis protein FlhB [Planctomycetota bacterium]|nr:flagellar biosynthesis protein FlhB [Planctomycetota bacterium]
MGDKTELPTAKRLSEARGKGQVAKSQDLVAAIDLIGALIALLIFASLVFHVSGELMLTLLDLGEHGLEFDPRAMLPWGLAWDAAIPVLAVFGVMALVTFLAHYVQFGFLFTLHPLMPDLQRLDPIAGLGRFVSKQNAVKTVISLIKLTLSGVVAGVVTWNAAGRIARLPALDATTAAKEVMRLAMEIVIWLLVIALVLGLLDFFFQRWQHTENLKMTRHQVEEERKDMEGDPEIKGKRLRMAREIALQRVNRDVPQATVVVTNPTHFSVALKYDASMRAPLVVAKGVDELALRIREVARTHKVPVIERPPLARALYAGVPVGGEVRPEHYQAVAEILALVYRLKEKPVGAASEPAAA